MPLQVAACARATNKMAKASDPMAKINPRLIDRISRWNNLFEITLSWAAFRFVATSRQIQLPKKLLNLNQTQCKT
jgi:hypothetical protein